MSKDEDWQLDRTFYSAKETFPVPDDIEGTWWSWKHSHTVYRVTRDREGLKALMYTEQGCKASVWIEHEMRKAIGNGAWVPLATAEGRRIALKGRL